MYRMSQPGRGDVQDLELSHVRPFPQAKPIVFDLKKWCAIFDQFSALLR